MSFFFFGTACVFSSSVESESLLESLLDSLEACLTGFGGAFLGYKSLVHKACMPEPMRKTDLATDGFRRSNWSGSGRFYFLL